MGQCVLTADFSGVSWQIIGGVRPPDPLPPPARSLRPWCVCVLPALHIYNGVFKSFYGHFGTNPFFATLV